MESANVLALFVEDEERILKKKLMIQRKQLRDSSSPLDLPTEEYIDVNIYFVINTYYFVFFSFEEKFRLSKECFLELFEEIENKMSPAQRTTRVPAILRFAAAINFYATGSYQHMIWHERIGKRMVGRSIHEVTNILEQHICPTWIKFPQTVQERQAIKMQFYDKFGIPGIVGCVDGTHVAMISPKNSEHIYVDRLHKHSLNVQLVTNSHQINNKLEIKKII